MEFNKISGDSKSTVAKRAGKKRAGKKTAAKKAASIKAANANADAPSVAAAKKRVKATRSAKPAAAQKQRAVSRVARVEEAVELTPAEGEEADPFEIAKQTMKGSVPAIVKAMVEKAKRGSCTHAKTLLEMTGARHMFGEEVQAQDSGEPWAKLVLERMEQAEQESLQQVPAEVAAES